MSGTIIPLSHAHLWANEVNFTCTVSQTRQTIYVQRNTGGVRVTIVTVKKKLSVHFLSVCLYPLVINMQCACPILSSVECPALQYFSALSHKR